MSRTWTRDEHGNLTETLDNPNECQYLCDDVCCNGMCDQMGEYVDPEFCHKRCFWFLAEGSED